MRAGLDHCGVLLKAEPLHTLKCQKNQQRFCAEEIFYRFQGVFDQKSSYNLMEFRATLSCDSWHSSLHATQASNHKVYLQLQTNLSTLQKGPQSSPVAPGGCTGCHTALHGASPSSRGGKMQLWDQKTLHILYHNQNRLDIFKTAPGGHLVMYFWAKRRAKMPGFIHLSQQEKR